MSPQYSAAVKALSNNPLLAGYFFCQLDNVLRVRALAFATLAA
jgi:hypothetical protein